MNTINNNKEFRAKVLDRIELDGVNLSEFSRDQKVEIIKTYSAIVLMEAGK